MLDAPFSRFFTLRLESVIRMRWIRVSSASTVFGLLIRDILDRGLCCVQARAVARELISMCASSNRGAPVCASNVLLKRELGMQCYCSI